MEDKGSLSGKDTIEARLAMKGIDGFFVLETKKSKKQIKAEKRRKRDIERDNARALKKRMVEKAHSFHFFHLPREIRDMIYAYLGLRPAGIIIKAGHPCPQKLWYEWDGWPVCPDNELLNIHWTREKKDHDKLTLSRTADATDEQLAIIKAGKWRQPDAAKYEEELASGKVVCFANRRDGGAEDDEPCYDILYMHQCDMPEDLNGLTWMRPSRQFYREATQIFYSGNSFVFEADGHDVLAASITKLFVHIDKMYVDGLLTPGESDRFKRLAFQKDVDHTKYWHPLRGIMFDFMRMIGERSASSLTNVRIEGKRKPPIDGHPYKRWVDTSSLWQSLPFYAKLLHVGCPNLTTLTLCMAGSGLFDGSRPYRGQDGAHHPDHHWKVQTVIADVVINLPNLKELRLGHYDLAWNIHQELGKHNYVAPYRLLEDGERLNDEEVTYRSYPNQGDVQPELDEWREALFWTHYVKLRAKGEMYRLGELGLGESLPNNCQPGAYDQNLAHSFHYEQM